VAVSGGRQAILPIPAAGDEVDRAVGLLLFYADEVASWFQRSSTKLAGQCRAAARRC